MVAVCRVTPPTGGSPAKASALAKQAVDEFYPQAALQIDQIRHWERELSKLSDDEVLKRGLHLRGRPRGCDPRLAEDKAMDYGFRRARVVDITPRRVIGFDYAALKTELFREGRAVGGVNAADFASFG